MAVGWHGPGKGRGGRADRFLLLLGWLNIVPGQLGNTNHSGEEVKLPGQTRCTWQGSSLRAKCCLLLPACQGYLLMESKHLAHKPQPEGQQPAASSCETWAGAVPALLALTPPWAH